MKLDRYKKDIINYASGLMSANKFKREDIRVAIVEYTEVCLDMDKECNRAFLKYVLNLKEPIFYY